MMFCLNTSNIAIIIVKGVDYCCIFYDNSISEATHLLENSVLGDCGYILIFFFFWMRKIYKDFTICFTRWEILKNMIEKILDG